MYLQPYFNPLVQVQKEMRRSTLNIAQLHNSDPSPAMPKGILSAANRKRSRSLDVLSEPHQSHLPPVLTESESRKSSLSGVSLESESSFSDDCSCSGSDSLSGSPTGMVEQHSANGDLAEGKFSTELNPLKTNSAPKVPPRPRNEEILSRCTTFTRKAALATKARLPELRQMQER